MNNEIICIYNNSSNTLEQLLMDLFKNYIERELKNIGEFYNT